MFQKIKYDQFEDKTINLVSKQPILLQKQARKSSEDAQAGGFAQFEEVWAG